MEAFPPGAWEVSRPNVVLWITEFGTAPPSRSINNIRDRLFTLGRRYDLLCRAIMYEDKVSDADAQGEDVHASVSDEPAAVPSKKSTKDKKKKASEPSTEQTKAPEPPTVANEVTVSFVRLILWFPVLIRVIFSVYHLYWPLISLRPICHPAGGLSLPALHDC